MTTSTATCTRPRTAAPPPWPPASSAPWAPTPWCSPIRATATWPPSALAEIVHAAHRGEKITAIFVNNAIYGMTGGQMAPTTLIGQKTTTSPLWPRRGRVRRAHQDVRDAGQLCPAPTTSSAWPSTTPPTSSRPRRPSRRPSSTRWRARASALVEVLSTCPTNWGMSPVEAMTWLEENMIPYYPLGVYKDKEAK